ncbi:MAG: hypothetical protein QM733_19550 [Ilumatobacteraceae bacterium]
METAPPRLASFTSPEAESAEPVFAVADDVVVPRLDRQPTSPRARIVRELAIVGERAEAIWQLYHEAFEPLRELALQQHLWSREEILAELANPRIVKFVGMSGDEPVGLCMVTNDLSAVPLISPEFLRARYPEQAARDAIFYGIVIFVRAGYRGRTLFARLGTHAGQEAASSCGVIVFDVCAFNREHASLDDNLRRLARSFPNSSMDLVDQQSWFAIEVPEPLEDFSRLQVRR